MEAPTRTDWAMQRLSHDVLTGELVPGESDRLTARLTGIAARSCAHPALVPDLRA